MVKIYKMYLDLMDYVDEEIPQICTIILGQCALNALP